MLLRSLMLEFIPPIALGYLLRHDVLKGEREVLQDFLGCED